MSTHRGIWLSMALLAACVGDRPDTGTETGTDTGTDTGTEPTLVDISVLLGPVAAGTTWSQLDVATQQALEDHAEAIYEGYRAEWGTAALLAKEAIVLADAGLIRDNVDLYVQGQFENFVDATFSVDTVASAALATQLRRLYLAHLAGSRNNLLYAGVLDLDWDGVTPLFQGPTSDPVTRAELEAYADSVTDELLALAAGGTLSADELELATQASFVARSVRSGSIGFVAYGGDDLHVPGSLANWGPTPLFDYLQLPLLGTTEAYLRAQNAMWMHEAPRYVSAHNVAVATDFVGPTAALSADFYDSLLPADPDTSRIALLLATFWTDRLQAHPDAGLTCRPYSDPEQERIVDAFLADLKLPYNPSYLPEFDARLDQESVLLTGRYQQSALDSLDIFDDVELPPAQRAAVEAAILAETRFGSLVTTIKDALTLQTGTAALADAYQAELTAIPVIGGYAFTGAVTVDPAHEAIVDQVWANVRAGLVAHNSTGTRVHPLDDHLPLEVTVDTEVATRVLSGEIFVGLGLYVNEAQLYVTLTHEALHALDNNAGLNPTGAAIEGAATLTAHPLAREILAEFAPPDRAAFYNLITATGDARRYGISDASVAVLTTDCPAGEDSAVLAADIAASWGASSSAIAEAPLRAHWGTQFLSYLGGQYEYQKIVEYFEEQIEPGVDNELDPFDLHSCGLVTPPLTPEVAAELELCLGL
jgi:hypothetical protein